MLVTFLVLLGLLLALSAIALMYGENGYNTSHELCACLGVIGVAVALIAVISGLCLSYSWYAAGAKATILNREYGTKYTQAEIFYASDVVEVIRNMDRKRVEVNGDLFRERDSERK